MAAPPPTADLNVPVAAAAHAVNPTTSLPSAHDHPAFAEMITGAIASLNEPNGSSKMAIAKYIEANYSNPQPTHSSLLTRHLKQLKDDGQILMAKFSYKLPGSALPAPVSGNGSVSVGQKRRRGRPPKNKSVQAAIPVFVGQSIPENPVLDISHQQQNAATGPFGSVSVATGQVDGPVVSGTPRGRGRPPKQGGVKPGQRRTTVSGGVQTIVGKSRGRPKKNTVASPVMPGTSRGRGRPPKNQRLGNVEGAVAAVDPGSVAVGVGTVAGKRRGRPPKAGSEAKKPRKLSGKPLGRHKKTASTAGSQTPVNLQQFACLDLKEKLQYFQSRIKQTVSIIKPLFNSETALTALQELETLAAMDVDTNYRTE